MNNKNILLVEDEAIIALAKKNELEKYNYTAAIVNTGEEAIEYINNDNHNIDLILMDTWRRVQVSQTERYYPLP